MRRAPASLLLLVFVGCPPVEIVGATCTPDVGCLDTGLVCRANRCVYPDGGHDEVDSGVQQDGGSDGGTDGGTDGGCTPKKPNVMWAVDLSASMSFAIFDGGPTRRQVLLEASTDVLTAHGSGMRLGLTTFPNGMLCGASDFMRLDIAAAEDSEVATLQGRADEMNVLLQSSNVIGGTPTAEVLTQLSTRPSLFDSRRQGWVVLITDGLPNCNGANPDNCDAGTCQCTSMPAAACGPGTPLCTLGCIDQTGALTAIDLLAGRGVRTVVVGLGAELTGSAGLGMLDAMANAGGYQRTCPNGTNAECRPSTCVTTTRKCTDNYYLAADAGELSTALGEVMRTLSGPRCP